jgi:hypothetical protein
MNVIGSAFPIVSRDEKAIKMVKFSMSQPA